MENVDFCIAVRNLHDETNPNQVLTRVISIYHSFISIHAANMINISGAVRAHINKKVQALSNHALTLNHEALAIFDDALFEVEQLLNHDTVSRFRKSLLESDEQSLLDPDSKKVSGKDRENKSKRYSFFSCVCFKSKSRILPEIKPTDSFKK